MAIPKKGSRKIVVDSVEYRWTIRSKPTYSQGAFGNNMTAAAELAEKSGAVLSIAFLWGRCDNWIVNLELPVTPKDIENFIRSALQNGWQLEKKGSAFKFVHEIKTYQSRKLGHKSVGFVRTSQNSSQLFFSWLQRRQVLK